MCTGEPWRYMGGRGVREACKLGDDGDARFRAFSEDVDRQGHNLTVWSRGVFEHGLNDGVTFCLVDYDNIVIRNVDGRPEYRRADGTWEAKTEAADRNNGGVRILCMCPPNVSLTGASGLPEARLLSRIFGTWRRWKSRTGCGGAGDISVSGLFF